MKSQHCVAYSRLGQQKAMVGVMMDVMVVGVEEEMKEEEVVGVAVKMEAD